MAIVNCKNCGKIFNYNVGEKVCPECRKKLADDFQRTKDYIRNHTGATIKDVAEACDVTVDEIKNWVRQERLVFTSGAAAVGIDCMGCGKSINTGKYCGECKSRMLRGFAPKKKEEKTEKKSTRPSGNETNRIRFK